MGGKVKVVGEIRMRAKAQECTPLFYIGHIKFWDVLQPEVTLLLP